MKENYIKSQFSETWLENGIIIQDVNNTIKEVSLEIAQQLIADRKTAAGAIEKSLPVLVFTNNAINIQKDAKKFYDTEEPYVRIKAIAMVMDNYIASFVARFVFSIKKNRVTTRVFNEEKDAREWLKQFVE